MNKKIKPQKQILKILSKKKAISINQLKEDTKKALKSPKKASFDQNESKPEYAISRSIKNLIDSNFVEVFETEQNEYLRLTPFGRQKNYRDELTETTSIINFNWDGFWRIILLDLPESRKSERESLRYLLKKAGFICLKNSVWISPHPFEHFFMNIKKDLNLSTEIIIIVTQFIDEETKKVLMKNFKI